MAASSTTARWGARCALLVCLLSLSHKAAVAGPVTINGPWYEFGFDPNHIPAVSGCAPADPSGVPCRPPEPGVTAVFLDAPPWTFNAVLPVQLTVTDSFLAGDYFDVFDFGVLIGSTPIVPADPSVSCGLNPDRCVNDPRISHASFLLAPGLHSLTLNVHAVQLQGEGFFRLTTVPEPATLLLFATGALGLYLKRRLRKA